MQLPSFVATIPVDVSVFSSFAILNRTDPAFLQKKIRYESADFHSNQMTVDKILNSGDLLSAKILPLRPFFYQSVH